MDMVMSLVAAGGVLLFMVFASLAVLFLAISSLVALGGGTVSLLEEIASRLRKTGSPYLRPSI